MRQRTDVPRQAAGATPAGSRRLLAVRQGRNDPPAHLALDKPAPVVLPFPSVPVIKATSLRDLKNRVNIHDVVVRVVALKKAGSGRFKGLCPFHSEKTPSFNVSADKGFYKCFGCGKAGDMINFVMETEGLQFTESVEAIAQRFGVTLEYEEGSGGPSKETRSLRQELFDIHDLAADYYRQAFLAATPHGEFIRDYWVKNRKFTPELADEFKIGFAPVEDSGLAAAMLKRKFSEDGLRQCGLFFIRDGVIPTLGNMRCRFRGRLMIPIRDHQGRVVAFTARQLEITPQDDASYEAKYVNSPETPIFTKSNLLFNLDRARTHAGEGHPFVLVEGQLDALRCWSVGLKTAIAPQGTSITEGQLALLRRYHPQVECFFDSDSAGQKAALRFLPMALKAGLEVRFLTLAGAAKLDPDLLFLEKGLAAYDDLKRDSLAAMPFAKQAFLPDPARASFNERMNAVRSMVEIALQADGQIARDGYLQQVSLLLGVQPDAIRSEVAGARAAQIQQRRTRDRSRGGASRLAHQRRRGASALRLSASGSVPPAVGFASAARMDRHDHDRRAAAGPRAGRGPAQRLERTRFTRATP